MNILILGGTGFLGNAVAQELSKNHSVTVTGLGNERTYSRIKSQNITLQETDALIDLLTEKRIDILMHFVSSLIPVSDNERYFSDIQNVYIPSLRLLEYCSQKKVKFVYISSGGAVYGNQYEEFIEESKLEPVSYYGLSKLNFENAILFYHNIYGLEYLIIRPSNPYGHGQNLYGKQGLIAVIIGKILKNEPIEIWGNGNAVKDFIYIDDFVYYVKIILGIKKAWNNIYNVGTGVSSSVNDVIDAFSTNGIALPQIRYISEKKADVKQMVLNCSKIQQLIPHDCLPLCDGIRKFYEETINK